MYQLAQLNIAKALAPVESEMLQEFSNNLDPVNAIAEAAPGFVWRLKDESGNATEIQYFDDPLMLVNMSVWQSVEALKNFMFKTHHIDFMKRKKNWFATMDKANYVLWWIEQGHIPTVEEAVERLEYLRAHGDSANAFSFKNTYPAVSAKNLV